MTYRTPSQSKYKNLGKLSDVEMIKMFLILTNINVDIGYMSLFYHIQVIDT